MIFFSFRFMVAIGFAILVLFILSAYYSLRNLVQKKRWLLKAAVWMIPAPFLASEAGWITAEMGRQPWAVYGLLPTWHSASSHSLTYMIFSLAGFVLLYTLFICVELYLMFKLARKGPEDEDGAANKLTNRGKGSLGLA